MFVNSDLTDLLKLLGVNSVRYLVIGGYAVIQYAEPRYTKDLDLLVSTDPKNAQVVFKTLREFGAPLAGLTEKDFAEEGYFYQMGIPPSRVYILMGIPGVEFEAAWQRRVHVDFDGLDVQFISRQDLINAKLAAGRPQDLLDVKALEKIVKRKNTKPARQKTTKRK